jgi:predicted dehydrogenase
MRGNGKKIRFGVLSTARIGVKKVIPAMQKGEHTEIVAIASRSTEKARGVARHLGIPRWHGSYEALLADPDVDAVYNPLPNDQHVLWSIRAIEAGKHVLCEKPIALSAAEGRVLFEATRRHHHLKVMEALMYRHHPQWRKAKELVETGQIGELRAIQVFFSFYNNDAGNIRNSSSRGGGALMDIGCYASSLSRWLFNAEPQRVFGLVVNDPHLGVDRLVSAILDFGVGHATFTCSMQIGHFQRAHLAGVEGHIELSEAPFNPPNDRPCIVRLQRGGEVQQLEVEACDQYRIQGDHFAQAILNDVPVPIPLEDAVGNMEVLDAIVASSCEGGWVRPAAVHPGSARERRTNRQSSRDDFPLHTHVRHCDLHVHNQKGT